MQPVVFHHAASRELWAELARHGLQVRVVAPADRHGLREALADAVALWRVGEPVTAALIAEAPRLRLIQQLGPDHPPGVVDLRAAQARGVAVCATPPGAATQAVAEMALALMLACLRRLPPLDRAVRAGAGWPPAEDQALCGEISGRTVGLLGYDAVAACLAPVLRAMGATLLYWDRRPKPEATAAFVPLRELIETSDIVSLTWR